MTSIQTQEGKGERPREMHSCQPGPCPRAPGHLPLAPRTLCVISLRKLLQTCPAGCRLPPSLAPSVWFSWLADSRIPQMDSRCLPHKWHMSVKAGGRPWPRTVPEGQASPPLPEINNEFQHVPSGHRLTPVQTLFSQELLSRKRTLPQIQL